ncbi:MAG: hypothetical protein AAGG75_13375 [Bacteroidota bacterium]
MKRVLVIGCSGSGKSTFATELARRTGLELIHLDQHYWKPHWIEPSKAEWTSISHQLTQKDHWVMDGNYGSTMDQRIERADTVIYLNMPTWLCLYRILKRWLQFRGRTRPSLPSDCPEKMDWTFFHYVLTFRQIRERGLLQKLADLPEGKRGIVLRSPQAVRAFWEGFAHPHPTPPK